MNFFPSFVMIKLFKNSFELTEPYNTKDMPYRRGINRIQAPKSNERA